jgi:hypothetical protein
MVKHPIGKGTFSSPEPNPWIPWLVGSLAAIAILSIALVVMKLSGLLDIPKNDTGAKTLAAALAVVGSSISAAVTLVGTVVKYSIDNRSARLAAVEAGRSYALSMNAEQRNRVEAAIRAVDLLGENNRDSTEHKIGGALLALSSLGEHDLAVALLNQLWSNNLVSAPIAETVLSWALEKGSEDAQIWAGAILLRHADQIEQDVYHIWPATQLKWRADLPPNCRVALVNAAAEWMKSQLAKDQHNLPIATILLVQALDDPDGDVRLVAAANLRPLMWAHLADIKMGGGYIALSIKEIGDRLNRLTDGASAEYDARVKSEIDGLLSPGVRKRKSGHSSGTAKSRHGRRRRASR